MPLLAAAPGTVGFWGWGLVPTSCPHRSCPCCSCRQAEHPQLCAPWDGHEGESTARALCLHVGKLKEVMPWLMLSIRGSKVLWPGGHRADLWWRYLKDFLKTCCALGV